jgi:signal transduction histidine kinase
MVYANKPGQELLEQNPDFIWKRMKARGLKIPIGSNKWETALNLNGEPRNYILSTSDIFREGKSIGVVLIFHDISSRKELEEDIRRANKGLSTLNQIIRHDMKNDLTALWGYLELLDVTDLDERQRELVRKMVERARSADDHLTFAKDNQSVGVVTTKWQDVQFIIEDAVKQVDLNGIWAEINLTGIRILADPMLSNVFYCLADNTVRHGGKAKKISVRGEDTDTGLSIIWEDDGVGVPSEEKQLIFNQGFGQNTGQGLFLVREILSMTGFTISEEGEPGVGASFVIRIPSGWYTWSKPKTS